MIDTGTFWLVTILLGVFTWLIRFSFLGLLGGRELPDWVLVHLRYVGVGVLPAMVVPMVLWPAATGGDADPMRIFAAFAALYAGWRYGVVAALAAGMATLWLLQAVTG